MYPVLLRIGSFPIYTYGFLMVLAWAAGVTLFLYQGRKNGLEEVLLGFSFWVILSGVMGARAFYVLGNLYWFLRHPEKILFVWQGGLTLHGGLLFAVISALCYTHRHHLSFWRIANIAAPSIALGISIGRIGCFFNGCCYGKPWKLGLIFPVSSPAGKAFPHQPIIPTQLISSADLLAIFFVLILLRRQDRLGGQLFPFFLLLYSAHRFGIEFLRGDHLPIFLHFTIAQFASIFLAILAFIMLWGKEKLSKGAVRWTGGR
ncbi:Phosphatidylglycerol--prolipoprotein diacylglyceryl transferase [subsurface metagenome]